MVCVLFNIAAMNSQIAALQSSEDDDSLKTAAKQFQQAAGIFNYLKDTVVSSVQSIRTFDIHPDCLAALGALMLAQAQDTFFKKARQGESLTYIFRQNSSRMVKPVTTDHHTFAQ